MNILFDIISSQGYTNGGAEYVNKVFSELLNRIPKQEQSIHIYCLFDSNLRFVYPENSPEALKNVQQITFVDIQKHTLEDIISDFNISTFFIGIAQRFGDFDFSKVKCRVIMVIHDLFDYEQKLNHVTGYVQSYYSKTFRLKRRIVKTRDFLLLKKKRTNSMGNIVNYLNSSSNYTIIAVSNYTKYSLMHYLPIKDNDIKVFYSPEKIAFINDEIENETLAKVINNKEKYYLLISANSPIKNAVKAIAAFKDFIKIYNINDIKIVTIGYGKTVFNQHIDLPFLSKPDLENAFKNAFALIYPSLFEGFGYPPMEAMKYGTPVASSNVCSIPEVLGDAAAYFSPIYETDFIKAYKNIYENRHLYSQKAKERYFVVNDRQKRDLENLIDLILK